MERIGVVPGTEVGGYRVLGPLGRGGMGAVYRAVDGGGAEVALKLLHPHLAEDDDARERLRREVAALQRVRHPSVARVLDAEIDSTDAFVVTEIVDGPDLATRVRQDGPLDPHEVAATADALRDALEVVHAAGVLHRDLSPGNVLLAERGPVLIDFGIAQGVEDARVTSTGLVVGTPGYLAPELLEGQDPSAASDWWGWAAVVAFAATGRPPFGSRPVQAVLARVRSGEADVAGLDPRTAAALRSALAVDPGDRATPAGVVEQLRLAAGGDLERDRSGDGREGTAVLGYGTVHRDTAVLGHARADDDTTVVGEEAYEDGRTLVAGELDGAARSAEADAAYEDRYDDGYGDEYEDDGHGADRYDYDPALDDHDIPSAYLAPTARRRVGTVLAAGTALAALGAVRPGLALAVAAGLAAVARAVGVAVGAVHARRARRGARRGDVPWTAVASPWYLVRGVLGVLPAVVVAASTVVVLGGVAWWALGTGRWVLVEPASGEPSGELPGNAAWVAWAVLGAVTAAGLLVLWFGPMMRPTRLGARWALEGVTPGLPGAVLVVAVSLVVAAVLVALTVADRPDVVWWPLPGAPTLRGL